MIIKLFQHFFVLFVASLFLNNISFAQDEIPEDVVVGGKAKCVLNGRGPIRRFTGDGNRLLVLQAGGISKGSIVIQSIFETEKTAIDINILALLGEIPDLDVFLGGEVLSFENGDSDLELKNTRKSDGKITEVKNQSGEGEKSTLNGRIKVTKFENSLASGILRFVFQKTFLSDVQTEDSAVTSEDNGKVVIICRFKKVPVAVKELAFKEFSN